MNYLSRKDTILFCIIALITAAILNAEALWICTWLMIEIFIAMAFSHAAICKESDRDIHLQYMDDYDAAYTNDPFGHEYMTVFKSYRLYERRGL